MNRPVMKKLTEQQRSDWAINGYICVEQALSAEEVDFFSDQIDQMRAKPGWEPSDLPVGHYGWVEKSEDLFFLLRSPGADEHGKLSAHQVFARDLFPSVAVEKPPCGFIHQQCTGPSDLADQTLQRSHLAGWMLLPVLGMILKLLGRSPFQLKG